MDISWNLERELDCVFAFIFSCRLFWSLQNSGSEKVIYFSFMNNDWPRVNHLSSFRSVWKPALVAILFMVCFVLFFVLNYFGLLEV